MINQISRTQKDLLNGKKVSRAKGKRALKILRRKKKKYKSIANKEKEQYTNKNSTKTQQASPKHINTLNKELIIDWSNIYFYDNKINFKVNNHFTEYYSCSQSKSSYNFLKKFFINKALNPLIVICKGNRPINVKNLDELNKIIEILSIEDFLRLEQINVPKERLNINKINLTKKDICKIYNLYNKSIFFEGLIELQDDDLKIIPVPEIILNKKFEIIKLEESFFFLVKKGKSIKIVWESIVEKKATYIFKCSENNYQKILQNLFDFISSPIIKNKRDTLIHNIFCKQRLMLIKRIKHHIPSFWVKEIEIA